jgi:predicted nicotinamide N-methyase
MCVQGLLAAKLGATVVLTDRIDKPAVLALNEANIAKNNLSSHCTVVKFMYGACPFVIYPSFPVKRLQAGLSWGEFTPSREAVTSTPLSSHSFDYILGADVFYDTTCSVVLPRFVRIMFPDPLVCLSSFQCLKTCSQPLHIS